MAALLFSGLLLMDFFGDSKQVPSVIAIGVTVAFQVAAYPASLLYRGGTKGTYRNNHVNEKM